MIELASLVVRQTKAQLLGAGLAIAQSLGVPVTSWQIGDPTDALFQYLTEVLDSVEALAATWTRAAFLDYAAADSSLYAWLTIVAQQGFGYAAREASYATTTVTLANGGGGNYPDLRAGQLRFQSSLTKATYHSTTGGNLLIGPGTELDVTVVADVAGSDSTADIGDIDTLLTSLPGVGCANAAAAIGLDAEPAMSIVSGCRAKLALMSPNGAADAYRYVATNAELTGTTACTSARVDADSDTGIVTVILAGPNMPLSDPDVAAIETAILATCTPLCVTPLVMSGTAQTIDVTYRAWAYASWGVTAAEAHAQITAALRAWLVTVPLRGDVVPPAATGCVYRNTIEATIRSVKPDKIFRVEVSLPAADVSIGAASKPVCGTVTASAPLELVPDPGVS